MNKTEPCKDIPHELGIVLDVVAKDQEKTNTILSIARVLMLHNQFEGRLCISGNVAFPFSPQDIPFGEVYRFCLNHVLEIDNPTEIFPIKYLEV